MLHSGASSKAAWGLSREWAQLSTQRTNFDSFIEDARNIDSCRRNEEAEFLSSLTASGCQTDAIQGAIWLFSEISTLMEASLSQFGSEAAGKTLHKMSEISDELLAVLEEKTRIDAKHRRLLELHEQAAASMSKALECQSARIDILQKSLDNALQEVDDMRTSQAWSAAYVRNVMHERVKWQDHHGMNPAHLAETRSFVKECQQTINFLQERPEDSKPNPGDDHQSVTKRFLARLESNNLGYSATYTTPREELSLLRGLLESSQDASFVGELKSLSATMEKEKSKRMKFIQAVTTTTTSGITRMRTAANNLREQVKSFQSDFTGELDRVKSKIIEQLAVESESRRDLLTQYHRLDSSKRRVSTNLSPNLGARNSTKMRRLSISVSATAQNDSLKPPVPEELPALEVENTPVPISTRVVASGQLDTTKNGWSSRSPSEAHVIVGLVPHREAEESSQARGNISVVAGSEKKGCPPFAPSDTLERLSKELDQNNSRDGSGVWTPTFLDEYTTPKPDEISSCLQTSPTTDRFQAEKAANKPFQPRKPAATPRLIADVFSAIDQPNLQRPVRALQRSRETVAKMDDRVAKALRLTETLVSETSKVQPGIPPPRGSSLYCDDIHFELSGTKLSRQPMSTRVADLGARRMKSREKNLPRKPVPGETEFRSWLAECENDGQLRK